MMLPCVRLNPDHDPARCNYCKRRANRTTHPRSASRVAVVASPKPRAARRSLPCIHEGAVLEWCTSCQGERKHVRDCDLHERCTRGFVSGKVQSCERCAEFDDGTPPKPSRAVRIDSTNLAPGAAGARFNASLIRWQGRLLMAYRTGWSGAQIHVTELADDYTPGPSFTLPLFFPRRANYGREDPRLFEHNGRLHVSYIGVSGRHGPTHQMYTVLRDDLSVERIHYPHLDGRQSWEKNWSMFSHDGELFAVYQCSPHTIVRIDGDHVEVVSVTDWSPKWSGGMLRGGAPPVRVGNQYWHWFHGRTGPNSSPTYNYGVIAFDAVPPFRPVAYTTQPLVVADPKTKPRDQYCPVVFPCGAVLDGQTWRVSLGVHDRWIEAHEWGHDRVQRSLTAV